ncbi:MAG: S23 ribosomal protein [Mesotoga prima]|uniref:S23 ribosomal protein n=1 Tax=Mesotoga prima TaxID=1184387 RepID=A0A117M1B8_9BACT|nr:MAG: S23 ribosomal protein [Mesotoga prima]
MAFFEMEIYEVSMSFVESVYKLTRSFPEEERYCLVSQMRRAALSIPSNIAEGNGRGHSKEYLHFLYNSRGSLMELRTQIDISKRLGYLNEVDYSSLIESYERLRRMLMNLISSIRRKSVSKSGLKEK